MANRKVLVQEDEWDIVERKSDGRFCLTVKMSLVRLGMTDKELVKRGEAVDLKQWVTAFVGTKKNCQSYFEKKLGYLSRMNTLYEYRG